MSGSGRGTTPSVAKPLADAHRLAAQKSVEADAAAAALVKNFGTSAEEAVRETRCLMKRSTKMTNVGPGTTLR